MDGSLAQAQIPLDKVWWSTWVSQVYYWFFLHLKVPWLPSQISLFGNFQLIFKQLLYQWRSIRRDMVEHSLSHMLHMPRHCAFGVKGKLLRAPACHTMHAAYVTYIQNTTLTIILFLLHGDHAWANLLPLCRPLVWMDDDLFTRHAVATKAVLVLKCSLVQNWFIM